LTVTREEWRKGSKGNREKGREFDSYKGGVEEGKQGK